MVNLSIFSQIFYVQKNIHLYKYPVFTLLQLIVTICYFILGVTGNLRVDDALTYFFIGLMIVGFAFFPLIYMYIAFKSTGPIRAQTFKISIAIILIAFGTLIQSQNVTFLLPDLVTNFQNALGISWVILPTMCSLAGVILLFSTYLIKLIGQ